MIIEKEKEILRYIEAEMEEDNAYEEPLPPTASQEENTTVATSKDASCAAEAEIAMLCETLERLRHHNDGDGGRENTRIESPSYRRRKFNHHDHRHRLQQQLWRQDSGTTKANHRGGGGTVPATDREDISHKDRIINSGNSYGVEKTTAPTIKYHRSISSRRLRKKVAYCGERNTRDRQQPRVEYSPAA